MSLQNDPAKEYVLLCQSALDRFEIDGYTEKHHIFPKCMCETKDEILDKTNLVTLSAKEHFLAHKLLSEMFDGAYKRKMLYAFSGLCFKKNGDRVLDADEYAFVKEASRMAKRGIPLTEGHKQKIRNSFADHNPNTGRKASNETKEKQRLKKIGTTRKQEVKDGISKKLKGIPKGPQPLLSCIVCRKSGGFRAIKQHHYNKCGEV